MKASQLRAQSREALKQELSKLQNELQTLRFEQHTSKLKNVRRLRTIRRDIARVLTISRQTQPA